MDVTGKFDELGKSVGKDAVENKLTSIRLYGVDGAKIHADMIAKDCHAVLEVLDGTESDTTFLHGLIDYILHRSK